MRFLAQQRTPSLILGFLLLAVAAEPAQAPKPIQLRSIKNLKCSFTASAVTTWPNGEPQVRVEPSPGPVVMTISKIDLDEEIATITGPGGVSMANARLSGSNLFFLDLQPNGSASLTTVFAQESRDKRLKAAHARTDPDVAQYYGDCEILR
jgi:hypothetical protein